MDSRLHTPDENRPLLYSGSHSDHGNRTAELQKSLSPKKTLSRSLNSIVTNRTYRLTACIFLIYFLLNFGLLALQVPGARLFERSVCQRYYRAHPRLGVPYGSFGEIPERLCKISSVQQEVALLVGWRDSFLAIPSILTAVFYGTFADRVGRKPVLLLAGIGELSVAVWILVICYFDTVFNPRLSWASALFVFAGGGQRVVVAMLFTIISDQIDVSQRTRYMYIINIGPHVSGLITPPIEAATMSVNVWLPFFIAILAYILMLAIIVVMPKAAPQTKSIATETIEESNEDAQSIILPPSHAALDMLKTPILLTCFSLFLITRIGFVSENFFYQFASANYDLELRQTPWFRSVKEIGAILVLSLMLPAITTLLRPKYNAQAVDLLTLRGSLVMMVISFLAVYLAPNSWLFALGVFLCGTGEGIDPGVQGLASAFVVADHRAMMFTILGMIDAIGKIVGGPLMAVLYSLRMDELGKSAGSCFLAASIIFGVGFLASFGSRLVDGKVVGEVDE